MSAPATDQEAAAEVLDFDAECRAIDDARRAAHEAFIEAARRGLTRADVEALDAVRRQLAARCEILRRAFHPRTGQLGVIRGTAFVISRTGRSHRVVWRRVSRR
ncbi:hypothetical protein [Nocardia wallacei]|uniref:hypothetical protein n=1 Tax=Nocardia wallacei TaxID=480035 RepID=UPI0024537568|nr:hypothetical protein [Nocardia wallacei]